MRKFVVITAVVLLGAVVGYIGYRFWQDYTNIKVAEETIRNRYTQTIETLGEIQDSLDAIALGDSTVRLLSRSLGAEQDLTQPISQDALDRIAELRGSIMRSKERITRLESELQKKGIKVAGLEKMIAKLRKSVAEKEGLIVQLSGTVDSLQTQIAGLASEVEQSQTALREREMTIEERRRELATVYYVAGPKRDLSASGVIVAKGGFLGIGRTLQPSGSIDESLLTPLDTDQQTVLELVSSKARVLSPQPTSSYELRELDGKIELHILDPHQFRKVRHLIIVTV